MLDFEPKFFLVLVVNFFALLFILNSILFQPLLKVFKERETTIKGSLDAAQEMTRRREDSIANLNRELSEARSKSKQVFDALRNEGLQKQKEVLSATSAEASGILEKARAEIKTEAEKARKTLRSDVDKFSDEIVRKLVKV
jgi:F-type H+-transporting ATPase subunit b